MSNLDRTYSADDRTEAFKQHVAGLLICLAGPGTGKTFSLLRRMEALSARSVSHENICYLTFIKEISRAFIEDYIDNYGQASYESQQPRISTLHSFACRVLRNQGFRIQYGGELHFANISDSSSLCTQVFLTDLLPYVYSDTCKSLAQLRAHLGTIKRHWTDLVNPTTQPDLIPSIFEKTKELLRVYRMLDWDQTVPLAEILLRTAIPIPDWVSQNQHYFVDEFQDFNQAEQSLILFLSGHAQSMVIVGDDDQSIYKSRGGSPEGIRQLHSNTTHDQVSLVKCYRCKSQIVTAANQFQASINPVPRPMIAVKTGATTNCYHLKSVKAEIQFLSTLLNGYMAALPADPSAKDGAVCLFPTWKHLDFYFDLLSPLIPCSKRMTTKADVRLQLEELLNFLAVPEQRFVQRLFIDHFVSIKARHKKIIVDRILARDISPRDAIESLLIEGSFKSNAEADCKRFCSFVDDFLSKDTARVLPHFVRMCGVDPATAPIQIDNYFVNLATADRDDLVSITADGLLPASALPLEDPKSVKFLTMHGSKGLTRKHVVLPGLEAASFPSSSIGDDLAEKKRLFFVAITRATDSVTITYPLYRGAGDPLAYQAMGKRTECPFVITAGISDTYVP